MFNFDTRFHQHKFKQFNKFQFEIIFCFTKVTFKLNVIIRAAFTFFALLSPPQKKPHVSKFGSPPPPCANIVKLTLTIYICILVGGSKIYFKLVLSYQGIYSKVWGRGVQLAGIQIIAYKNNYIQSIVTGHGILLFTYLFISVSMCI